MTSHQYSILHDWIIGGLILALVGILLFQVFGCGTMPIQDQFNENRSPTSQATTFPYSTKP